MQIDLQARKTDHHNEVREGTIGQSSRQARAYNSLMGCTNSPPATPTLTRSLRSVASQLSRTTTRAISSRTKRAGVRLSTFPWDYRNRLHTFTRIISAARLSAQQ